MQTFLSILVLKRYFRISFYFCLWQPFQTLPMSFHVRKFVSSGNIERFSIGLGGIRIFNIRSACFPHRPFYRTISTYQARSFKVQKFVEDIRWEKLKSWKSAQFLRQYTWWSCLFVQNKKVIQFAWLLKFVTNHWVTLYKISKIFVELFVK